MVQTMLKLITYSCKIISTKTSEEIFSFQFDNEFIKENDSINAKADYQQLVGITCEDGKICTILVMVSQIVDHPILVQFLLGITMIKLYHYQ